MHTYNPVILKNLLGFTEPFIKEKVIPLPEWRSYAGVHEEPAKIVLDGKPPRIMELGDTWEASLDTTRYFETEFTVPREFEGRKIYFAADFGGEAIVRINGKIAGAVSSAQCGGWVHRNRILFHEPLKAGQKLDIEIENGINAGGYFDYAYPDFRPAVYKMEYAQFEIINEEAEKLWYDLECAWDIYENSEDEYVRRRVYNVIDTAAHALDYDFGPEKFYAGIPGAERLLWEGLGKIEYRTPGDVIMCGHSHLDVAWLWTKKEITRKCARTFANNVSLMKNYPDFRFTQSQAVCYDFVKQHYPDVYEDVRRFVKNGQWEITGNAWVEADTNIASGESLIRQLLVGRNFFMSEFGVSSDIYWLPDCFGFTAALPQIIKRSGMKYFLTSKLQYNDTNEFPDSIFRWRSHSGDEVLAYMQKVHYEGDGDAAYIVNTRKSNRQNDLADASMGMFGYGDGGGGCTYDMIEKIERFEKMPGLPKVRMAQAEDFFAEIDKDADEYPVWDGEMYYENHRGTFTSQAFVKKNNRRGEYMLRNAEMLSLLAGTYDADKLLKLWKLLLENQFHDILPGTSIHEVFENTKKEYALLRKEGKEYTDRAFAVLNKKAAKGDSVVVWNLISYVNSAPVKLEGNYEGMSVRDASGRVMPSVYSGGVLEFTAEDVPPMGYKVFSLCKAGNEGSVSADKFRLENRNIKACFDENAHLISLIDKKSGREVLAGPSNRLSISHDKPFHESAWNLENDYQMKMHYLDAPDSIEIIVDTPAKAVLRTVHRFNRSVITQDITLTDEASTLIFDTTVDWHEDHKVLKAEFDTDIRARYASYEIAHGALERPTYANNSYEKAMFEVCAHKWADLSDASRGLSVINDCKYGYDIQGNVMRITLMRAPTIPDMTADRGINTFRYGCYPHAGTWSTASTVYEAEKENIPMYAFDIKGGQGTDDERSFISLSRDGIMTDAVKKAEDGRGFIIRLNEVGNREDELTVSLPLDSFMYNECNMMETDEEEPRMAQGSFTFRIHPYEVRTFRILPPDEKK